MNPTRHVRTTVLPVTACLYGVTLLLGCGEASPDDPDAAPIDARPVPIDSTVDAALPINPCQFPIDDEARPGHPFDVQRFEAEILPDLRSSCASAACHLGPDSPTGYNVWLDGDSACATVESFNAFYAYIDFAVDPANSPLLRNLDGTLEHPGVIADTGFMDELTAFIEDAHARYTGGATPGEACAPASRFDLTAFADEIMPFLAGQVDYNDPEGGSVTTGCARAECHGSDRGPGTLHIDPARSPAENLDSFRCFVNQYNPAASQALLCPLNLPGCRTRPHPGADLFSGFEDLNYQKLLGYILAARNGAALLDFAFFARKIDPMLNDENAVQDGLLGLTCASQGCHFALPGQSPDNGANFGITPEATEPAALFLNYAQATKFVFAPEESQSSLLLYPTNEVANPGNAAATGLDHPGGECFAIADPESLDLLQFVGGLRPDGEGFLRHVLVAGLFPATDVTDAPPFDEDTTTPRIFDRSGQAAQYNQGLWDLYASETESVDLLDAFSVASAEAHIVVAVAYVINTTARDLDTVITIDSPNDVALIVGTPPGQVDQAIGRDGAGTSLTTSLPAFESSRQLTRILVKAYQQAGAAGLGFTIRFADENGNLLTSATRELVFTLGGEGGGL
jgi:hypothetical protein